MQGKPKKLALFTAYFATKYIELLPYDVETFLA